MQPELDMNSVIDLLIKRVAAYVIILFGSYGKGIARADSDIDLAYLGDKQLSDYENFMLAQEIAGLVGKDVDLLDLGRASTVIKAQIIAGGKVVYCGDEKRKADFFMKALKEYALLNDERAVVLREIERRGSVYGH